jgi:hypothetical protein
VEHGSIRREVSKFPVEVEGDSGPNRVEDIYITELGYVMVSIYNAEKKVYVNSSMLIIFHRFIIPHNKFNLSGKKVSKVTMRPSVCLIS